MKNETIAGKTEKHRHNLNIDNSISFSFVTIAAIPNGIINARRRIVGFPAYSK
ncbi:hypothetical protein GCM10008910_48710 [Faecalicatena orotica]